jgi:hypothetical protein
MAAPGISPLANQLADRALRARMIYTVRIERTGDGRMNLDTGLVDSGLKTVVYEGIGGLYVKNRSDIQLPDGSWSGSQVMGLIPRDGDKPRVDDAFTIVTAPPFSVQEVGQVFTILDVTGGGRLGPMWQFTLSGMEPDKHWDGES